MPPIARATRSMPDIAGQEQRQHDVGQEEDRHERHAADDLDVGRCDRMRTAGSALRRPSASSTPSGNDSTMLTTASRSVSSRPPHRLVLTDGSRSAVAEAARAAGTTTGSETTHAQRQRAGAARGRRSADREADATTSAALSARPADRHEPDGRDEHQHARCSSLAGRELDRQRPRRAARRPPPRARQHRQHGQAQPDPPRLGRRDSGRSGTGAGCR